MLYSVLLPAHRNDSHLAQAVASVEAAMEGDRAELILIANGPERAAIAARYAGRPKIRIVISDLPSLVHALNRGLELSTGRFVARMDSDDVCLPGRFKAQTARLEQGGVDFLFTRAEFVDDALQPIVVHDERWPNFPTLAFNPIHPTVMARREALVALGGYGNIELAEDRHLWLAAIAKGYSFDRLDQPFLRYRLHTGQSTAAAKMPAGLSTSVGLDLSHALRNARWGMAIHALTIGLSRVFRASVRARFLRDGSGGCEPAGGAAVHLSEPDTKPGRDARADVLGGECRLPARA
jgi:hypothetical protein